eukprot:g3098.t1
MDLVIDLVEDYAVAPALQWTNKTDYDSGEMLARDSLVRQFGVGWLAYTLGGLLSYFLTAGFAYIFLHRPARAKDAAGDDTPVRGVCSSLRHMPYDGQVLDEIAMSVRAIPVMAALTTPFILMEYNGLSKLYSENDGNYAYAALSTVLFVLFTDVAIYFIHRALHHPILYKRIHKPHHRWLSPTPFSSHAFHPVDGWMQSLPYHAFIFIMPMNSYVHLGMFIFVNVWTVLIHDGVTTKPPKWLLGAAHHTIHHSDFSYNYGEFFTVCDRVFGTLRTPYGGKGRDLDSVRFQFKKKKNK